jgi:ParB family chromosome partitioning protein
MSTTEIPLSAIRPNPDQPRRRFDDAGVLELAASIHENGLLQPITVRADGRGRYMIVAGERRYRAHLVAGLKSIRAEVVDVDDEQLAVAAIVENLQRADITPLEEAQAFARLVDAGMTPERLAERLGLKQPWRVADRLRLLTIAPDLLDLFAKGQLTPSQATELARLAARGQRALFALIRDGRCETYAALRAAADGLLAAEAQAQMFDVPPAPTPDEQVRLGRVERLIDKLVRLCNAGIADNDVVLLKRVDPDRASILAEQLSLIRADLAKMETALRQSAAQRALELA